MVRADANFEPICCIEKVGVFRRRACGRCIRAVVARAPAGGNHVTHFLRETASEEDRCCQACGAREFVGTRQELWFE